MTGAPPAPRGLAAGLPWAIAGIALVALIALVVGQRFGARPGVTAGATVGATEVLDGANGQGTTVITAPGAPLGGSAGAAPDGAPAGAMPRAPDISQLTPEQRAERLYDRIMSESEAGRAQNVRTFLPMAIASYQMLDSLTLDQRYDLGRIAEVGGDTALARAQADTILTRRPTHLLGLILAAKAARLERQEQRARSFDQRLLAAEPAERASGLGEYLLHKNDLDAALAAARSPRK
jgi:hypothetical protein